MTKLSSTLRKAAVLVAALDERTADALLAQMGPEQSAKIRRALVELDEIPADEQQQVLAEFLGRQDSPVSTAAADDTVALQLSSAADVETAASNPQATTVTHTSPVAQPPLAFLQQVAAGPLADLLRREYPQTVAVVLGRLPAQQAAAVLEQLPASLATEALERMAWLGELAPEVVSDIANQLRKQLGPSLQSAGGASLSVGHLSAVLEAMDDCQRQRVVQQLAKRNAALLRRLGMTPPSHPAAEATQVVSFRYRLESDRREAQRGETSLLSFDDFALLDDETLRTVFAAADLQVALLALIGADQRLLARILHHLPAQEADVLRQRLDHPGPVRLREIEEAQLQLAAIASSLARKEAIRLPPSVRFAAAV